jgi:hypothetical protein
VEEWSGQFFGSIDESLQSTFLGYPVCFTLGVYALSRSVLSAPAGVLAESFGWSNSFLLIVISVVPVFLLLGQLAPWTATGAKGAYDSLKDEGNGKF